MKVLVTGANGQLGHDVINELNKRGYISVGTDVDDMDITDKDSVFNRLSEEKPDAVIHCAAYTAVDAAEENIELCRKINAEGTENVAMACSQLNIKLMYISTDYVFDGTGEMFRDPDEKRDPLNVYGQTKCEGEIAIESVMQKYFIVRISWVFGVNGKNFVKTMLRLAENNNEIKVVNDQIGSPTYTFDLAILLVDMIETEKYGRYHATNEGICSWYDFAKEIFRLTGKNITVVPVTSADFNAKAKRPSNSRMSKEKLSNNGFERLPTWQDALERFLKEIN